MDFKAELLKTLLPLAASAMLALGTLALAALRRYLDSKASASNLATALAVLPHAVEAVWNDVAPATEKELEADMADGKLSADEMQALKAHALENLKASLSKNGLAALKGAFGPLLDSFLSKKLDAMASGAQAPAAPAASPTSPQ